MPISILCPGCSQELEAPDEMAGQAVECPYCQAQMTVPAAVQETPEPEPSAPQESADMSSGGVLNLDALVGDAEPTPAEAPATGGCPECGAGMEDGAVLCVQCGFHTGMGKKISTDL